MTHFKLLAELERDIRNQVVISQMLRLNRRQKLMVSLRRHGPAYFFLTAAVLWILACCTVLHAQDVAHYPCPDNLPCKILTLNAQEERALLTPNGVLDTAAQARNLDLGQFVVYLKQRIATAPAGEVKKDESKPADKEVPKQ